MANLADDIIPEPYMQISSIVGSVKVNWINGLPEPESPNFDPNHAFLSSIETEIITFLPKKAAI